MLVLRLCVLLGLVLAYAEGNRSCWTRRESVQMRSIRKQIKCSRNPDLRTLVPLQSPDLDYNMVDPPIVLVRRCNDVRYCTAMNMRCLPITTSNRTFTVELMKISNGMIQKKCGQVTVTQHTSCGCMCPPEIKLKCDASNSMEYDMLECECKCLPRLREECQLRVEARGDVMWDEASCTCPCTVRKPCGNGMFWNHEICDCTNEINSLDN